MVLTATLLALTSRKQFVLFMIGIVTVLTVLYGIHKLHAYWKSNEKNSGVNDDYEYFEMPIMKLYRKLLSEAWSTEDYSLLGPDVNYATANKRTKRAVVSSDSTEENISQFGISSDSEQSQNKVILNGNDQLEWKIDVHVARRTASSEKTPVPEKSSEDKKQIPLNIERGVTHESDGFKLNEGLGMKLTVEGRGGESSSYLDLQKAWASVGLLLKTFFEENREQNLGNNPGVGIISDKTLQASSLQRNGILVNGTLSNGTKLQDRALPTQEDSNLSGVAEENSNAGLQIVPEISRATTTPYDENEISEEGFFDAEQRKMLLRTSEGPNEYFSFTSDFRTYISGNADGTENSSERNMEPRFMFGFFNRGSGNLELPTTESTVDTHNRVRRFIFDFFRPRPTSSQHVTESGSGDNSENNANHSRSSRVELDDQLSDMKTIQETLENTSLSDIFNVSEDFNKTDVPVPEKRERFFWGVFETGSGDSRELMSNNQSEEYTSVDHVSFNDTVSDVTQKNEISNPDYFLETFTERDPLEAHDADVSMSVLDYDDTYYNHSTKFNRSVNVWEYDLVKERIRSVTDGADETTEIPDTTKQLDPRFFLGGLFSEGSGDELLFRAKMENDSQTLFPSLSAENRTFQNDSVLDLSYTHENSDTVIISEAAPKYISYEFNTDEAKYTSASPGTENDLKEANSEHTSSKATTQAEKLSSDFYFIDTQRLSDENDPVEYTIEIVTNLNNDTSWSDKVSSSNAGLVSNGDTTDVLSMGPRRGARLLDDHYDCYDSECLRSADKYGNTSIGEADLVEDPDTRDLDSIHGLNDSYSVFGSPTKKSIVKNEKIAVSRTSAFSESTVRAETFTSTKDIPSDEEKNINHESYGFNLHDSETYTDFNSSEVVATIKIPYLMDVLSTPELRGMNILPTTEDFNQTQISVSREHSTTPLPRKTLLCKASWQCDEMLNEQCINGSTCGCGESFIRHPNTRRCEATCVPGYCGDHGVCEIIEGSLKCKCQGWFLGDRCQMSGVVMVGSASTGLILLIIIVLMACIVWRRKRSSAYGSDIEKRFQRTEEYGLEQKGAKALGDVLPMEKSTAVPSRFLYVGNTPHPQLHQHKVPRITITSPSPTSPSVSDNSMYDFSDSTFDSVKS